MASIGENLRRLRKAAGLSQPQLAELTGVSQQLISQIETGKNATTKELAAFATALGVSIYEIDESYTPDLLNVPDVTKELAEVFRRVMSASEEVQKRVIRFALFELDHGDRRRENETKPRD